MNAVGANTRPSRCSREKTSSLGRARAETTQYLPQLSYALYLFSFSFSGLPFLETIDLHRLVSCRFCSLRQWVLTLHLFSGR